MKITPRMADVLRALALAAKSAYRETMTGNRIARACGFTKGNVRTDSSHNGTFLGPANRVIFTLIGLRKRGLVTYGARRDGKSGTAYELTGAGHDFVREHRLDRASYP